MAKRGKGDNAPVVIKRGGEEAAHGHHGGAWKIAYADFVTAMMAFFLLMWLVNASTDAQRRGIADYFAPVNLAGRSVTGSGQPFGGRSMTSDGNLTADSSVLPMVRMSNPGSESDGEDDEEARPPGRRPVGPAQEQPARQPAEAPPPPPPARSEAERREAMAQAAEEIRQAIRNDPALAQLGRQLLVEEVPEGLRIQVVDSEGQPIFATGQGAPNERGRALLARAATVVARLPHPVEITGHTDATPFRGGDRTNWELSAERANAVRRLLIEQGVAEPRIRGVQGRAEREPLVPGQPLDAVNRRVAVLVLFPQPGPGAAAR
jgi:chemotaxis protein MotB